MNSRHRERQRSLLLILRNNCRTSLYILFCDSDSKSEKVEFYKNFNCHEVCLNYVICVNGLASNSDTVE